MAKKNYKKFLPKAGSTLAVAVAMTVALSTQAHATELDETELLPGGDPVEGQESNKNLNATEMAPAEYNEAVEQENQENLNENQDAVEGNEDTHQNNADAAQKNETDTEGAMEKPDMDLPDAPDVPETEGEDVDGYNEAVGEYNKEVDEYNEKVDEYNEKVDEYNDAADVYDQEQLDKYEEDKSEHEAAQEKHEADLEQQEQDDAAYDEYQKEKEAYDQANSDYQEALDKYEESLKENQADGEARNHYQQEKAAYDKAHAEYLAALEKYNSSLSEHDPGSAEYQKYLEDKAAYDQACAEYLAALEKYNNEILPGYEADSAEYQKYLEDKAAYDKAYAEYLEKLYEYNHETLPGYQEKEDQVDQEEKLLEEVNKYNDEVAAKNEQIEKNNAALEDNVDVGVVESVDDVGALNQNIQMDEATLEILKNVGTLIEEQDALEAAGAALANHPDKGAELGSDAYAKYLEDVAKHNDAVDAFNAKVAAYNEAVARYNKAVDDFNATQSDSSSSSTSEAQGAEKADWGNFENKNMSFNHMDVRYDAAAVKDKIVDEKGNVIGYSDSTSKYDVEGVYYNQEAAESNSEQYGITYTDTKGKEIEYEMVKDNDHDEFSTASTDWWGNIDRTDASANKNTVVKFYATLSDGKGELKDISVTLDANSVYADNSYVKYDEHDHLGDYRDSDGKGLNLVKIGDEWYYDVSGQSVYLISALVCDGYEYNLGGLDLILNVQTMIEIHQAESAQKIGYMTYELEKYAATEDQTVSDPGQKPNAPTFELKELPPVNDPGKRPDAPSYNPGAFTDSKPEATERLEKLDTLDKLEEKVVIQFEEPVDPPVNPNPIPDPTPDPTPDPIPDPIPDPTPDPIPDPVPVVINDDFEIDISDEEVPLAAVPKTGDISALWSVLSGFSAAGMFLLGRKRKGEEE